VSEESSVAAIEILMPMRDAAAWVTAAWQSLLRWAKVLESRGVEVEMAEHCPGGRSPRVGRSSVFCFGHAGARERVRLGLEGLEEGERYLFVA
jgi:hypothetical protein